MLKIAKKAEPCRRRAGESPEFNSARRRCGLAAVFCTTRAGRSVLQGTSRPADGVGRGRDVNYTLDLPIWLNMLFSQSGG